ncbi:hypothetical protein D3C73_1036420 [compost metagenome]
MFMLLHLQRLQEHEIFHHQPALFRNSLLQDLSDDLQISRSGQHIIVHNFVFSHNPVGIAGEPGFINFNPVAADQTLIDKRSRLCHIRFGFDPAAGFLKRIGRQAD